MMIEFKLGGYNPDLNYEISAGSETLPNTMQLSHLHTALLAHLISNTDTDFWQKHDNEVTPSEFYAAILGAIAQHYAVDCIEENIPAHKLLKQLIDELNQHGYLNELLPVWDDED